MSARGSRLHRRKFNGLGPQAAASPQSRSGVHGSGRFSTSPPPCRRGTTPSWARRTSGLRPRLRRRARRRRRRGRGSATPEQSGIDDAAATYRLRRPWIPTTSPGPREVREHLGGAPEPPGSSSTGTARSSPKARSPRGRVLIACGLPRSAPTALDAYTSGCEEGLRPRRDDGAVHVAAIRGASLVHGVQMMGHHHKRGMWA